MAQLLIKANADNTHPDADISARQCFKRGDVIARKPDNFTGWGRKECLPKFLVVKVPGSVEDVAYMTKPERETGTIMDAQGVLSRLKCQRSYRLDIDAKIGPALLATIGAAEWMVPEISTNDIDMKDF